MSRFVWYDLMTDDCASAATFYGNVVGWTNASAGQPGSDYSFFLDKLGGVGGLMSISDEGRANGMLPNWTGYVGVADVDAFISQVTALGGSVHRPAEDIPTVGRFAVVADPHGAVFILFQPMGDGSASDDTTSPGRVGWCELHAGDLDADFAFYAKLFGWTLDHTMEMGPMGTYRMFGNGFKTIGGMVAKRPESPKPYWLFYFVVDGIDAAIDRVKQGGGSVSSGPNEVPGNLWVAVCDDPSGASFGLSAPRR